MTTLIQLQPFIPHYRSEFFRLLSRKVTQHIFVYEKKEAASKANFHIDDNGCEHIANIFIGGKILFYTPLPLLRAKCSALILMLNFAHVTTWLLLLTKFIHKRKIILWGQGISVKRYIAEEKAPDWKFRLMIALSDGVWLYTPKELTLWRKLFPNKPMSALGNTISNIQTILDNNTPGNKTVLKERYGIKQRKILIFCARFETTHRRVDLLIETIKRLDKDEFGFVIIGAGSYKPNFKEFPNVYDFGAVYDQNKKSELFSLSDMYFQPGWVGLSIVEAMAYGLPILTFERSNEILQCVEYAYIKNNENGLIFKTLDECVETISNISQERITYLSVNAKQYVAENLTMDKMVDNALGVVKNVCGSQYME